MYVQTLEIYIQNLDYISKIWIIYPKFGFQTHEQLCPSLDDALHWKPSRCWRQEAKVLHPKYSTISFSVTKHFTEKLHLLNSHASVFFLEKCWNIKSTHLFWGDKTFTEMLHQLLASLQEMFLFRKCLLPKSLHFESISISEQKRAAVLVAGRRCCRHEGF